MTVMDDHFDYRGGYHRDPGGTGATLNGLEHSWVAGEVALEWPAHLYAGFGAKPKLTVGAYSYSNSHISPHVASIGRYCSIAEDVIFGHQEHPTQWLSTSSFTYEPSFMVPAPGGFIPYNAFQVRTLPDEGKRRPIQIGNDVWIGYRAYIRGGVHLGDGCIVGANAVVTHDVPPFAIVVGNPARVIRYRFDRGIVRRIQEVEWWRYDFTRFADVDIRDVSAALRELRRLIDGGLAPMTPPVTVLTATEPTPALRAHLHSGPVPIPSRRS